MNHSPDRLKKIVSPPPHPEETALPDLRLQLEQLMHTRLPNDLFLYGSVYGSGEIVTQDGDTVLRIFNPYSETFKKSLDSFHNFYRDFPILTNRVPYKIFPSVGGLFGWGESTKGRSLFWATEGDPDTWPIILRTAEGTPARFEMPMIEFLVQLLSDKIPEWDNIEVSAIPATKERFVFQPDLPSDVTKIPPSHKAIMIGNHAELVQLLDDGADPNTKDYSGDSLISKAIANCDTESVKILLERGADLGEVVGKGDFPLHAAAGIKNHLLILQLLLDHGADVNAQDVNGWSALHFAIQIGEIENIQALLSAKADPNLETKEGKTPLYLARKQPLVQKMLRDAGARG